MKKDNYPLSKGRKILNLLLVLLIFLTVGSVLGSYYAGFRIGYKYYEKQNDEIIQIGITQEENFSNRVIEERLQELQDNEYTIVSFEKQNELIVKKEIIKNTEINEEHLKEEIQNDLLINTTLIKLNFNDDTNVYYFKTKDKCDNFINELNNYIQQEYTIDNIEANYDIITSQDVLEQKINNTIKQKEEIDAENKRLEEQRAAEEAERRRKAEEMASRNTITRTYSGAPLASYFYISSNYSGWHTGIDYAAATNTQIYAWKEGTVVFAGWDNSGYGNFIIIQHNDGTRSRYAHCNSIAVYYGQYVSKGQVIGYVGSTGNSTR